MATYIPNITDTGLDTPLYQPDFNFINQMLQRRTAMYDQGFNQVKSAFSTIATADLKAQGNAETRNAYIRQAEEKLKNLSSVDLSLPQNVQAANAVFEPFWKDEDILQDYMKTKGATAAKQKGYALMESSDPKEREQFWQTGIDAIDQGLKELSMAKRGDGSIARANVLNRYIPFYDVNKYLREEAKAQGGPNGLTFENLPVAQGGFLKKTINGDNAVPVFEEWAARMLANNARAMDVFRLEGTVAFKNKVFNIVDTQGVDINTAKTLLADKEIQDIKETKQEMYNRFSTEKAKLQNRLEGLEKKYNRNPDAVTPEETALFDNLNKQYKSLDEKTTEYEEELKKYENTNSPEFDKIRKAIIGNGESYFAENRRDNVIKNFARSWAANVKYDIQADPVAKLNAEMSYNYAKMAQDATMFNVKQAGNEDGTALGSASKRTKTAEEEKNTPVTLSTNVRGNDPIGTYQRNRGKLLDLQDRFLNSGLSVIMDGKKVSKVYTDYLNNVIRTGNYTATQELKDEHARLQSQGLIPKNVKLGQTPSMIYDSLYKTAEDYLIASGDVVYTLQTMAERHKVAVDYNNMKAGYEAAGSRVAADPKFKKYFKGNELDYSFDKFVDEKLGSKNDYITNNMGKVKVVRYRRDGEGGTEPVYATITKEDALADYNKQRFSLKNEYEKTIEKVQVKIGENLQNVMGEDSATGALLVQISGKQAQDAAIQVLSPVNLGEQDVSPDGILPINVSNLVKEGADEDELVNLIKNISSYPENFVDKVNLTKVGFKGKPSVTILLNQKNIKENFPEFYKTLSEGTLRAVNFLGLELQAGKAVTVIPEFKNEFSTAALDKLVLDKEGRLKAPEVLRKLDMDYNITVNPYDRKYVVEIQYPEFKNGKTQQAPPIRYDIPITNSLSELQKDLFRTLSQHYQSYRSARDNYKPSNTRIVNGVPVTTNSSTSSWTSYKQANNMK
jgi:hypothetical protein